MKKNTILASVLIAAAFGEMAVQAQSFNYTQGDLLAAFRKAGSSDLVLDLGPIANYQVNDGHTSTFTLGTDLTGTFGGSSGVSWSVFTFDGNDNTLWMTAPRGSVGVQTSPLRTSTSSAQNLVTGQIGAIGDALSATYGTIIDNQVIQLPNNLGTFTGGDPAAYTVALGNSQDFNGTFGQNFENLSSGSSTTVSDLYQLNPTPIHNDADGIYLGNFTLAADGSTFTFNAVPEPSTLALVGSGVISLLAFRRRANRK